MRRHYCFNCGKDIGPRDRFSDQLDTCGKQECDREARNAHAMRREEAHDQLDRDNGWDGGWY